MAEGLSLGHVRSGRRLSARSAHDVVVPELHELLRRLFDDERLTRAVLSKPRCTGTATRIVVEPVDLRGRGGIPLHEPPRGQGDSSQPTPRGRTRAPGAAACRLSPGPAPSPTPIGRCSVRTCSAVRRRDRFRIVATAAASGTSSRRGRRSLPRGAGRDDTRGTGSAASRIGTTSSVR